MEVSILGTIYKIEEKAGEQCAVLAECDGYCETQTKKIIVKKIAPEGDSLEDLKSYQAKVLRHEIIHAFLYESGLDINSDWARNEEIIDWIALQVKKMIRAFSDANCL